MPGALSGDSKRMSSRGSPLNNEGLKNYISVNGAESGTHTRRKKYGLDWQNVQSRRLENLAAQRIVSLKRDYVLHIRILLGHVADKRKASKRKEAGYSILTVFRLGTFTGLRKTIRSWVGLITT